jgi:hypothetical protein
MLKPRELITLFLKVDFFILQAESGMSTLLPQKKAARLRQRFVGKESRGLAPRVSTRGCLAALPATRKI